MTEQVLIDDAEVLAYMDKLLDTIDADTGNVVMTMAARQAGLILERDVKNTYPPTRRPIPGSQWWTTKQRRWFWSAASRKADGDKSLLPGWRTWYEDGPRGGKILRVSGYYLRTNVLVNSFTTDIQSEDGQIRIVYGTNVPYAKWVIDKINQANYHRGNWEPLQDIVTSSLPDMQQQFIHHIAAILEDE